MVPRTVHGKTQEGNVVLVEANGHDVLSRHELNPYSFEVELLCAPTLSPANVRET